MKNQRKLKSALFLIVTFLVISSCSVNKARIDNGLEKYFEAQGVEGSFTMLDNADGSITVYNMALDTQRLGPASTFKILNALVALETGIATDTSMKIKWDGQRRSTPELNQDLTLAQAFRLSSVSHFQELARKIGKDTMQHWIDTIGYGNRQLGTSIDSFWLNNSLKISPDEQLGFLKRLYFDQLPFRKSTQEMVRALMLQEDNTLYKLSYKTGLGIAQDSSQIGWVTGWIEENRHVYFFVTLVKTPNQKIDLPKARLHITRDILKDLGFLQGNM